MKLETWFVTYNYDDSFSLNGYVYGHPNFEDGTYVRTSKIVAIKDQKVQTYSGSEYELGEMDPFYEDEGPTVKQELLDGGYNS